MVRYTAVKMIYAVVYLILSEYGEDGATFLHKLFTGRMLNVIRRFLLKTFIAEISQLLKNQL